MVKYQRKKCKESIIVDEDEESCLDPSGILRNYYVHSSKRGKPKSFLIFLAILVSCGLVFVSMVLLFSSSTFSLLHSFGNEKHGLGSDGNGLLCSTVPDGSICCDRTSVRSDICVMKGDVRTHSDSSSVRIYRDIGEPISEMVIQHEKIKPYTRKWEASVMKTIDELDLVVEPSSVYDRPCDVEHDVPAVFLSTGGYTGNLYHEFNDGILPLYITSQHMHKKVVFVILEYHSWWITKYGDVLSELSDFPAIDFSGDNRTHCFPKAIVGLRIHDELSINPALMEGNRSIGDFRDLLNRAYWLRIQGLIEDEEREAHAGFNVGEVRMMSGRRGLDKPKLVIMSRNGSRGITNEDALVRMAKGIGFLVEVVRPERTTELAKIYRTLNSSDVMVGVHGAAMTHFLFMRPKSVFIQVVPLGTEWAAETYYGEPARKLGLKYMNYEILPKESSLYDQYDKDDLILRDPSSVTSKGWDLTKKIYLDDQTVRLNLKRFRKRLIRAYYYTNAARKSPSPRGVHWE